MCVLFKGTDMEFDLVSLLNRGLIVITNNPSQWIIFLLITVLLCRLLWSSFIHQISEGGVHYVNTERAPLNMITFHNPFIFDVNVQKASYAGVECTLSCEKDCYVLGVWGVPVYELFELLNKTWSDLKNTITTPLHDEKFSSRCICSNDPFLLVAREKKVMEFKPHWDIEKSNLEPPGPFNRQSYPFVVIMTLKKDFDIKEEYVVAMANVVHIPDSLLKLPSYLLGQYLKLSSGPVGAIKKIFVSSPERSNGDEPFDLCLACYHRAISPVFLPCRHACVCSVCFEFCEMCPICRGPAYFHFELNEAPRR